jgi:hypothetical protein
LAEGAGKVFNVWANQDPHTAGAWLGENQQHPAYDGMAAQYARAIAGEYPQVAHIWTQSIADEKVRAAAERANARVYLDREGEAGTQALLEAGYSPDVIIRLSGVLESGLSEFPTELHSYRIEPQNDGWVPVQVRSGVEQDSGVLFHFTTRELDTAP